MKKIFLMLIGLGIVGLFFEGCNSDDIKNYEPSPYSDTQFSKNVKLSVKETDITTDTEEITLVFENLSSKVYNFDQQPFLEIKYNDGWVVVPYKTDISWNDIAYGIDKNDTTEYTFVFSYSYEKLSQGEYRIIKKIWTEEIKEDEYAVAEFIITE